MKAQSCSLEDCRRQVASLEKEISDLRLRLAGEVKTRSLPRERFHVVRCRVRRDSVAFHLDAVDVVVQTARVTSLPEGPPWAMGLLNLRGTMIPVIDVQARIHQTDPSTDLNDLIVVCKHRTGRIGFVVQDVLGIDEVRPSAIEEPPTDIPFARYVLGVLRIHDGKPTLLLSHHRLVGTSLGPPDTDAE